MGQASAPLREKPTGADGVWLCQIRRDVEERAEQLKGISYLAARVAGFVMLSYLQFGFDVAGQNPGVLIGFGLTTAVVVRGTRVWLVQPSPFTYSVAGDALGLGAAVVC